MKAFIVPDQVREYSPEPAFGKLAANLDEYGRFGKLTANRSMTLAARNGGYRELRLYRDLYLFDVRRSFGNNIVIDPHPFDVKLDRLAYEFTRFLHRGGGEPGRMSVVGLRVLVLRERVSREDWMTCMNRRRLTQGVSIRPSLPTNWPNP
jgi:hypothetical protein